MSREYSYHQEDDQPDEVVVDELLNGLNDWRSVPDIVRLTFKALSDVIKNHTAALRDFEIQIATKANRSELVQKANISDLNRFISESRSMGEGKHLETIQTLLEEKLTRKECNYMISGKFNDFKSELDKKADLRELQSEVRGLKTMIEDVNHKKSSGKEVEGIYKALEQKVSVGEFNATLEDRVSKQFLANSLSKKVNRSDLEALLLSKADMSELQSLLAILDNKADKHLIDNLHREIQMKPERSEIAKIVREEVGKKTDALESGDSMNRIKREFEYKLNHFDKYIESLRVNIEQTQATLAEEIANKMSGGDPEIRTEITRFTSSVKTELRKLEEKNSEKMHKIENSLKSVYEEFNDVKSKLGGLLFRLDEKDKKDPSIDNLRQDLRLSLSRDYEKILKELSNTKSFLENYVDARIKDLRSILETKSDKYDTDALLSEHKYTRIHSEEIDILKRSLESVHKKGLIEVYEILDSLRTDLMHKASTQDLISGLNAKVNVDDIKELVQNDDKMIIEALCSENCTGRWLWKSGELSSGFTVPWEIQSVNTCPENFIWEKDALAIITITPGLYEVFFGFFTGKKPSVQMLVNGDVVFLDTNGDSKNWGKHRDGNIIGATLTEYIALPARARLCITYSGPRIVEGFISLRKL